MVLVAQLLFSVARGYEAFGCDIVALHQEPLDRKSPRLRKLLIVRIGPARVGMAAHHEVRLRELSIAQRRPELFETADRLRAIAEES